MWSTVCKVINCSLLNQLPALYFQTTFCFMMNRLCNKLSEKCTKLDAFSVGKERHYVDLTKLFITEILL